LNPEGCRESGIVHQKQTLNVIFTPSFATYPADRQIHLSPQWDKKSN
jgi:hypothetical protein